MHIFVSICTFIFFSLPPALSNPVNSWDSNALESTAIAQPYQEIELAPQQSGILKVVQVEVFSCVNCSGKTKTIKRYFVKKPMRLFPVSMEKKRIKNKKHGTSLGEKRI